MNAPKRCAGSGLKVGRDAAQYSSDGLAGCEICHGRVPVVSGRLVNHYPSPPARRSSSGTAQRVGDLIRGQMPKGRGGFLIGDGCAFSALVLALLFCIGAGVAWWILDPVSAAAALIALLLAGELEVWLARRAIASKGDLP